MTSYFSDMSQYTGGRHSFQIMSEPFLMTSQQLLLFSYWVELDYWRNWETIGIVRDKKKNIRWRKRLRHRRISYADYCLCLLQVAIHPISIKVNWSDRKIKPPSTSHTWNSVWKILCAIITKRKLPRLTRFVFKNYLILVLKWPSFMWIVNEGSEKIW